MPRPKAARAPEIANTTNEEAVGKAQAAADALAIAQVGVPAAMAEAFETLGKMKMANGFRQISAAAEILSYSRIQEGKLFKYLPVTHADGKVRPAESFEQFCNLLNPARGYKAVIEDMAQMRALGYPVYEALKAADVDRKQFRMLLKAPDDARAELIAGEAVDLKDPDAVREHIEMLAESLQRIEKALDSEKQEREADQELLEQKQAKIDKLERANSKRVPFDAQLNKATTALKEITDLCEENLTGLTAMLTHIEELMAEAPAEQKTSVAQQVFEQINRMFAAANTATEAANEIFGAHLSAGKAE